MLTMHTFHDLMRASSPRETFLLSLARLAQARLAELRARLEGSRDTWVLW